MDSYSSVVNTIALSMGAAWASGINLYAAVLMLGALGITGNVALPESLAVLQNPLVIGAAAVMYIVEFFADKVPGLDTGWDTVHTFIRVPAGAMLAAGAVGDLNPAAAVAAGILGAGVATGTHASKAGTRVLINTSPEPVSNWAASIMEDIAVVTGLWAALKHPGWFIVFFILFILLLIWLLPKLWRGIKKVGRLIGQLFTGAKRATLKESASGKTQEAPQREGEAGDEIAQETGDEIAARLQQLEDLRNKKLITDQEYHQKRQALVQQL